MKFDFGIKKLNKGEYEITVTKKLSVTVHSDYNADESDLIVKTITLGDLKEFSIEEKPTQRNGFCSKHGDFRPFDFCRDCELR